VRRVADLRRRLVGALASGPTPVGEVLARSKLMFDDTKDALATEKELPLMEAFRGNFARARDLAAQRESMASELGLRLALAGVKNLAAKVAMVAGDSATAEQKWRESCDLFREMGERAFL
jgi:hypothetical protein